MSPAQRLVPVLILHALFAAAGRPAAAEEAPAAKAAEAKTPTAVVVEPGDLVLSVDREGRIDAPRRAKVRVTPEAFGGPFEVVAVEKDGGPVARGDVLVRFDPKNLDDELRGARQALEEARTKLDTLRREQRLQQEEARTRLEKGERAKVLADEALVLFERVHGPKMLKVAELEVKGREHGLEGQREELAQLEKMYQGTRLASDTKEIVLERARRGVALSEAWLEVAKKDQAVGREHEHPNRERQVRDEARWAGEELERTREGARIAEARKKTEIEGAALGLRQAEERVGKLEGDRERLTLKAPESGLLTRIDLDPGDVVQPRQVIAQVVPSGKPVVRIDATAEDLRVLASGSKVEVLLPDVPEVVLAGTVTELATLGAEAKDATTFPATVALGELPPPVKLGMRAVVHIERTIAGALAVPRAAVRQKGARALVYVKTAAGPLEAREVVLGPGSDERVQVLAGLKAGETVLGEVPAEKDAPKPGAGPRPKAPAEGVQAPAGAPGATGVHERTLADAVREGPAAVPEDVYAKGVAFLVGTQNPDGSWGSFESSRDGEIYLGTIASHHAFREATTALCVMALQGPSRRDPRARAALERGVAHLVAAEPAARATGDTFYDTWTHAYLLSALARIGRDDRFAAKREAILTVARREVEILRDRQAADGGYGYYDFGNAFPTPSGDLSTSFITAVVLDAFHEARKAGLEVPKAVIEDALRCVERLRLPSGAYVYGTYAENRPGVLFNRVKGSLGRSQPCNLVLRIFERDITPGELVAGLANLRANHHFIEIGKARPYPHEAWYYTAGYYFLFGHYYAARVIDWIEPAGEQAAWRGWLGATMARLQDPDGSWFDFPFYGYHKPYGTAFALLTLEACLGERLARAGRAQD